MVVIRGGVHPLNNIPTVGTSIQWGNIIHTNIIVTVGSSSIHPLNKFPTVGSSSSRCTKQYCNSGG